MNSSLPRQFLIVIPLLLFTCSVPPSLFAWGPEGHRIIARIAKGHLTSKSKTAIKKLLPAGTSIDSVSNWADRIRPFQPVTAPWHYVDIPIGETSYDPDRDCKDGNCVVGMIEQFEETLSDKTEEASLRVQALKFLIHFIGDLHQPLHCADDDDRGGNDVSVKFFGKKSNLHKVWDSGIIDHIGFTETGYLRKLSKEISTDDITEYEKGSVADWAIESHQLAVDVAYGKKPDDNNLDDTYYNDAKPVVDEQLSRAGIRLAKVLNEIFN